MLHSRMLAYLDEVARVGSIRGAAERLGIAASSINRQILDLEEEYGIKLFERLPRRLRLTVAGEFLLAHVRQTLRDEDVLRARFVGLVGMRQGHVRIAAVAGVVPPVMPPLLRVMQTKFPAVKLSVRALSLEDVVAAVLAGEADLGLGYQVPQDRRLRVVTRAQARLGALVRKGHKLAGLASISLADCVGFPMVLPDRSLVIGTILQDALERASIGVERQTETNSLEFLRYAATINDTIAFLNEFEARATAIPGLVFVPLRGPAALSQELVLVARRSSALDGAQSRVAEELNAILLPQSEVAKGSTR